MQYLGGKSKTAQMIGGYLNLVRQPGQAYWEPFVGAGWVLDKIRAGAIYASDANPALIAMWQALQAGWVPPGVVTEAMYKAAQEGEYRPELEAFIMFGCSFSGKWNGGYARGEGRNFADEGKRRILWSAGKNKTVQFFHADFITAPTPAPGCLIYCDPPYANTSGYGNVPPWEPDRFWQRVRELESEGHTVVVSEYKAPDDFDCVVRMTSRMGLETTTGKQLRIERLFRLGEHLPLQAGLWEVEG